MSDASLNGREPARLRVDALSVQYGSIRAVQAASLSLAVGITALVGSNGAGKSSLVKAIAGLVPISGGAVRAADGSEITRMPSHRRVHELGIVLVPEGRGVLPRMTVAENLEFGLRVGRKRRYGRARATADSTRVLDDLFDLFPQLRQRYRLPARLLSGGEQQMLAIARALAMEPDVLLVDEPSLGLSPALVASVFEAISQVVLARDIALLLIEQDTRAALALSRSAYVMERGRVTLSGPSAELAAGPLLRAAYLGELERPREESQR